MDISIKVINDKPFVYNGLKYCKGEISIGNRKEQFDIPIEWWKVAQYKRQWQEGLERIKHKKQSCLVTEVQGLKGNKIVTMWALYKKDGKIYIQNHMLSNSLYEKTIGKKAFTIQTCYQFVEPRGNDPEISEWVIDAE